MRIAYIARKASKNSLFRQFNIKVKGLTDGQSGFFEAALSEAGQMQSLSLRDFLALDQTQLDAFDAVVVNTKCGVNWDGGATDLMQKLASARGAKGLFLTGAHPQEMFENAVLDAFDVIFKREPYADLDRYGLSPANRAKIVPTHLSNPFVRLSTKYPSRNRMKPLRRYSWETPDLYEVSFLGSDNNRKVGERTALWERILDEGFHAFGGIIPMKNSTLPDRVIAKKMSRPKYMKNVFQSTINLAPSGHGPFTYRHLELFWAGAFVLSNPGIREQQLRAPLIEGRDYIAYDDLDDMVDKTRHYLEAEAERKAIARNGRAAYEVLYDVPAHAREIRAALEGGRASNG